MVYPLISLLYFIIPHRRDGTTRMPFSPHYNVTVEGTGFEPVDRFNPVRSLANCWFKPLTQPSINYFQRILTNKIVKASINWTNVFGVNTWLKCNGYKNAATIIPVMKNRNLLLHISPLNAFTPYSDANIQMNVAPIAIIYGQGVLIQLGTLNCQYMIYQCKKEPKVKSVKE